MKNDKGNVMSLQGTASGVTRHEQGLSRAKGAPGQGDASGNLFASPGAQHRMGRERVVEGKSSGAQFGAAQRTHTIRKATN